MGTLPKRSMTEKQSMKEKHRFESTHVIDNRPPPQSECNPPSNIPPEMLALGQIMKAAAASVSGNQHATDYQQFMQAFDPNAMNKFEPIRCQPGRVFQPIKFEVSL